MHIKPAVPGNVVRYPTDPRRVLREEGEEVPDDDLNWRRRIRDGSVVVVVATPGPDSIAPLTTR